MEEDSDKIPAAEAEEGVVRNSNEATEYEFAHFVIRTTMVNTMKCMKWVTRRLATVAGATIEIALPAAIAMGCVLLGWKFSQQVQTGSILGNTVTSVFFVAGACHGGYFGAFGGASAAMAVYPCFPTIVAGALMGGVLGVHVGAWTAAVVAEGIVYWIGQLFAH